MLSIILLQVLQPNWFQRLDGLAYDLKLKNFSAFLQQQSSRKSNIQIVDIDEKSLTEIGRWPWPRSKLAQLVNHLTKLGAVVVSFDMIFSEPQQNPIDNILQNPIDESTQQQLLNIYSQFDDDTIFAKQIATNDVILGSLFLNEKSSHKGSISTAKITQNTPTNTQNNLTTFAGYNASIAKLNMAAAGQGFINAIVAQDGIIRKAALISRYQSALYPSLALETFRVYSLAEAITPLWKTHQNYSLLLGVEIGNELIQTDNNGQILIPFKGGVKTFTYTSASDILQNRITDHRFKNAVVFVGTSAVGMADLRATPVSLVYPGVEIHATIFNALLNPNQQPIQPDWWLGANIFLIVFLGLFLSIMLPNRSPKTMLIGTFVVFTLTILLNILLWQRYHLHLPILAPIFVISAISVITITISLFEENTKRKQVKAIFDQYVPPAHIEQLLNSPNNISMSGERKQLTVLFADIRNFTALSEGLSANKLKHWLNRYFSPITEIIFNHQGTIDKYVGDMVMAFWGAPISDNYHTKHAIEAALEMLACTDKLSEQFKAENLPAVSIGIGLNTGEMNVGDMGSSFRRAYTVLGDSVNLASRLEALTKYYGVPLLVSEFCKLAAPDFIYQSIDKVKVKGKEQAIFIYMPIANTATQKQQAHVALFNKFFSFYQNKQWKNAKICLLDYQQTQQQPYLCKLYLKRLAYLTKNPPDQTWDGTYTHLYK
jgi:adenylate cyclase